jgi:hypothetical protein
MSSDNGIYILLLKDECRVIYAQAIENLYWDFETKKIGDKYISTRLVEYFQNAKSFKNVDDAHDYAFKQAEEVGSLENGICSIPLQNKTWKSIIKEAKTKAEKEIKAIKKTKCKTKFSNDLVALSRLLIAI